jgi:sodium transport system permease protein
MKLNHIATVYRKELVDQLRDRRTLISMILVPLVAFPLLTVGFGLVAAELIERARQERSTVMLLGAEAAPELAETIRQDPELEIVPPADDYVERITQKELRAAVRFPAGLEERLRTDRGADPPTIRVYHYTGELRSELAVRKLEKLFGSYRSRIVEHRLARRELPRNMVEPFLTEEENVVSPERVAGNLLGGLLPYFIILLSLIGALYPAMDLTAGEKERGTIETIMASPVGRTELVAGKFLMVLTASLTTALLALFSLAATLLAAPGFLRELSDTQFPFIISASGVGAVFLMVVPLAVMFSAALLAISLLAKSYREAQSYVQPLMIVVILPAVAALLPGVELTPKLSGNYPWELIALIFGSSCLCAAAALFVAVRAFQRESVLFRT